MNDHHVEDDVTRRHDLLDRLRRVRDATSSVDRSATEARLRLGEALSAVTEYLDGFAEIHEEKLADPLWSLLLALGDLERGKQADFLKADSPAKGGAPPMPLGQQTVMGMSAVAVDMLMSFEGLTSADAAEKVARTLTKAGFKLPARAKRQTLAGVVEDWRHRLNGRPGLAPSLASRQWDDYKKMLRRGPPNVDSDGWLSELRDFVTGIQWSNSD